MSTNVDASANTSQKLCEAAKRAIADAEAIRQHSAALKEQNRRLKEQIDSHNEAEKKPLPVAKGETKKSAQVSPSRSRD